METRIQEAVTQALASAGAPDVSFAVERPNEYAHGDYAVNAAMAAAKMLGKNPKELATTLAASIKEALGTDVATVGVAGPGFINITLAREFYPAALLKAASAGKEWGMGQANAGKRIIVEYSCPNPFKEMHIGHLMSTIIGEAVARITEYSSATVFRDTYDGDVGPHVARALWGLQKAGVSEPGSAAEVGKAYEHGSRAYSESEEVKAQIDDLNRAIYRGEDQAVMELWRKGRQVCLTAFDEIYQTLGTTFDYYFFESETAGPGMDLVRSGLERGVFEESDGAIIYKGEKKGLHTLVFVTSKGTPTYETKEVGLAFVKEERCPTDAVLILTAAEQIGHFSVVKAALEEIAPLLGAKTTHVPHGFLRLTSGKMSSREGNIVTAASLINDTIEKVSEKNPDPIVAEQVALGAIKYMILRQAPGGDIIFDFDTSLSVDGDSGPYLQYALVRAKSVMAQSVEMPSAADVPAEPYLLERLIARFPEIVARAQAERAPHHVAQYLTTLAGEWSSFYAKERIRGGDYEVYKLLVARAFVTTMENGLWLLGIPAPEKM